MTKISHQKVSVITPVFNGEKYIEDCIKSVLSQKYINIEHIIIDDCSNDSTECIIKKYPQIIYQKQDKLGANIARNNGLKISTGSYIKFLDADDILAVDAVEMQLKATSLIGDKEISYGYNEIFDDAGDSKTIRRMEDAAYSNKIVDLLLRNIVTSLPLYPRSALDAINGFDERLIARQEWNLNLRLSLSGYKFKYCDVLTYKQREHNGINRISNRLMNPIKEYENLKIAIAPFLDMQDQDVTNAVATYVWGVGRQFILKGQAKDAGLFFDYAKKISPGGYNEYFSGKYRLFQRFFKPELIDLFYKRILYFKILT